MRKTALILFAIASMFGMYSCSKVEGEVTMTYTKATAIYGSIDSIRELPLLAESRNVSYPVGFYVGKNYVLVGERGEGIHIFDDLNMQNPGRKSFLRIPFNKEFYVKDDILYAESGYDLLKIDLRDINNPVILSRVKNAFGNLHYNDKNELILGFAYRTVTESFDPSQPEPKEIKKNRTLYVDYKNNMIPLSAVPSMFTGDNGKSKGTLNRISAYRNYVYVVAKDKMHVFSNYSLHSPMQKTAVVDVAENAETIYGSEGKLYIGSESEMTIFTEGSFPNRLGSLSHEVACDPILPVGNIAYFTLRAVANEGCSPSGSNTLSVVDIEKPKSPTLLRTIELKSPYGLAMINDNLFVGEGRNGLTVFRAMDKKNPKKLNTFSDIKAFDITTNPFDNNKIIVTTASGIEQYTVNWTTMQLQLVNTLNYKL